MSSGVGDAKLANGTNSLVDSPVLLNASGLTKSFALKRNLLGQTTESLRAVDGVDLRMSAGTTLGLVGESGSGKSTLGRIIARLIRPDAGSIELGGMEVSRLRGRELKALRARLQVIFQNPYGALDSTKTIAHAVAEPLLVHGRVKRSEMVRSAAELLGRVGLNPELVNRYPDALSGGQRQRVCIARALALSPELLVADEPTSALDLSTRSEILNLLLRLQEEDGQGIVLISHDFATVRHLAHRIAVMYLGRVVEEGPAEEVANNPLHPYTQALLSAVLAPNPQVQRNQQRTILRGEAPNPANLPTGCRFRTRCPAAMDSCARIDPTLQEVRRDHKAACLLYGEPAVVPASTATPTK
jgi:oligopeptide/dipeptide ABC transporter ATP-binding protein